jgi:DNA-binding transcriptional MocR family regulator
MDDDGIEPESLRSALLMDPTILVIQPRSQNPTGASMTHERADQLAGILEPYPEVLIVEDDHVGDVSMAEPVSLGEWLPDRTIHIRSFSMSHGPDLRLAAVAGPPDFMTVLINRRRLGPGWSSRLLQTILLGLLTSPAAQKQIQTAREVYARRRLSLADELTGYGVDWRGRDGFNLWIAVRSERDAMVALAAQGVGVAAGEQFKVEALGPEHIRVTTSLLRDDFEEAGRMIALAALGMSSEMVARGAH